MITSKNVPFRRGWHSITAQPGSRWGHVLCRVS